MSKPATVPFSVTLHVRDTCLCLGAQRAARSLARRFDDVLRPLDLTNGQFSLMMSLNRPHSPGIAATARFLAMDRTTLTAALEPLQRRGLVTVSIDPDDKRGRLLKLTRKGQTLLVRAVAIWERAHADLDDAVGGPGEASRIRQALGTILVADAAPSASMRAAG